MNTYFTIYYAIIHNWKLFISVVVKAATYKKGAGFIGSLGVGFVLTFFEEIMHMRFLGISLLFFMAGAVLICGDFLTGIMVAMKENKGKDWIDKDKLIFSAFKLLFIMVLLLLAYAIHQTVLDEQKAIKSDFWAAVYGSAASTISIIRTVLFALVLGKEYISIGENIEKRFGKKHYVFRIFEKLFEIIELKFLRKIENSDFCGGETKKKEDETNEKL